MFDAIEVRLLLFGKVILDKFEQLENALGEIFATLSGKISVLNFVQFENAFDSTVTTPSGIVYSFLEFPAG